MQNIVPGAMLVYLGGLPKIGVSTAAKFIPKFIRHPKLWSKIGSSAIKEHGGKALSNAILGTMGGASLDFASAVYTNKTLEEHIGDSFQWPIFMGKMLNSGYLMSWNSIKTLFRYAKNYKEGRKPFRDFKRTISKLYKWKKELDKPILSGNPPFQQHFSLMYLGYLNKIKARRFYVWLLFYLKGTRYQPILKGNLL